MGTYLSTRYIVLFFTLLFIFGFFQNLFLASIFFVLFGMLLFLTRRPLISYRDNIGSELLFFPCNGKVKKIERVQDNICIYISLGLWQGWSITSPMDAVIESVFHFHGKRPWFGLKEINKLEGKEYLELSLRDRSQRKLKISFVPKSFGKSVRLWVDSGDKAKSGALMGYFPWGGHIIIRTNLAINAQVVPGQKVKRNETVLLERIHHE